MSIESSGRALLALGVFAASVAISGSAVADPLAQPYGFAAPGTDARGFHSRPAMHGLSRHEASRFAPRHFHDGPGVARHGFVYGAGHLHHRGFRHRGSAFVHRSPPFAATGYFGGFSGVSPAYGHGPSIVINNEAPSYPPAFPVVPGIRAAPVGQPVVYVIESPRPSVRRGTRVVTGEPMPSAVDEVIKAERRAQAYDGPRVVHLEVRRGR